MVDALKDYGGEAFAFRQVLVDLDLPDLPAPTVGKVRLAYDIDGQKRILVATDRLSAFDRHLTSIPFKGQVLTELSRFWFDRTASICPNHMIATPDPNVMVCRRLRMLPVEVVVRGFLAGSTSTSLLTMYRNGQRRMYGHDFQDGMRANQPLEKPIITPTTKGSALAHDMPIDCEGVVEQGLVDRRTWDRACDVALAVFAAGQNLARRRGLILVDTKYEFGVDDAGEVVLADEVHTPDSSRFWDAATYSERFEQGVAPDAFDKDRARRWVQAQCDPYKDDIPPIPDAIRAETAAVYLDLFERLTGARLAPPSEPPPLRIARAIGDWLRQAPGA